MKTLWIAFNNHKEERENKFVPEKYVSGDGKTVRIIIYLQEEKAFSFAGCFLINKDGLKKIIETYGSENIAFGNKEYDLMRKKWCGSETITKLKEIQETVDALAEMVNSKDF